LRPHADEFERAGATLAVIGNGWPAMAKSFAEHVGFPPSVRFLTDPKREAYQAAKLKHSMLATLGPRAAANFLRAFRKGFRQGRTQGDPWQQGGTLIVRPGGEVAWKYVSEEPGDHPAPETILAKLRS
jgi:hypothetical protein